MNRVEVNSLYRVEGPGEGRSPLIVAQELVALMRSEYRYHTADLCRLLLCERQWIDREVQGNVRHIFITKYFRDYIAAHVALTAEERSRLLHGFYFFSADDLARYWRENAVAECKTRLIDLADYQRGGFTAELKSELEFHRAAHPSAKEKKRHLARMESLLTSEGFRLYSDGITNAKAFCPCALPEFSEHLPLTNLVRYRRDHALNSNAVAMQHLIRAGGIRIKLGSRALWLLPSKAGLRVPFAVPVDSRTVSGS